MMIYCQFREIYNMLDNHINLKNNVYFIWLLAISIEYPDFTIIQ